MEVDPAATDQPDVELREVRSALDRLVEARLQGRLSARAEIAYQRLTEREEYLLLNPGAGSFDTRVLTRP